MLRGVHAGLERCRPGRGVYRGTFMLRARERLPVDQKGDGVFRLRDTVEGLAGGNASGSARSDTRGDGPALHDPAMDVDVVRRQIVAVSPTQKGIPVVYIVIHT